MMTITLTPEQEARLQIFVEDGTYKDIHAALDAALRLLKQEHLNDLLQAGVDQLARGE